MAGRRGSVLELAVLGLLHDSPMHGYELRKRVNAQLGWGRVLSYGTLYPSLKQMLRAGLITATTDPALSEAGSKRPRITYELTAEGKERFVDMIGDAGPATWEDETFDVRFSLFARTDPATRLRILEGRRARMEERLANLRESLARTGERTDRYTLELQRHGLDACEREVRWLSELIDSERDDHKRSRSNSTTPPRNRQ